MAVKSIKIVYTRIFLIRIKQIIRTQNFDKTLKLKKIIKNMK